MHEQRLRVNSRLEHDDVRAVDEMRGLWGKHGSQVHRRLLSGTHDRVCRQRSREGVLDAIGSEEVRVAHNVVQLRI